MKIDLAQMAFSMAGSYMAISELPENYRGAGNQNGIHLRTVRGGAVSSVIGRIVPLVDGVEADYSCQTQPEELILSVGEGCLRICYADPLTILVKAQGEGIGWRMDFCPMAPFFDHIYEVPCRDHIRYMANCFGQNVKYLLWAQQGKAEMTQIWNGCTAEKNKISFFGTPLLTVIREVHSEWDGVVREYDYEACRSQTGALFQAFHRKMPEVPAQYEETARVASYVAWSSIVAKSGFLPRDTMYMSKNWMNNIWAWDHCFNAVALAYGNPEAAWDQWMIPFDLQDPTGLIPDTTNNSKLDWNYCKPPVHGWALSRMMKVMELSESQILLAYDKLEKWTLWWLNYRDHDHDGICEYTHGYDSGWDNATVFREQPCVELPDLQTFLILQMDTLAELAERMGREESTVYWRRRAEKMLSDMLQHCFADGYPVAVHDTTHEIIPSRCLILYMPILLGDRLPEKIRENMLEVLRGDEFLTEYGYATESTKSELYDPDGYWRGPIWAPATILLLDGLSTCGEMELVRKVATSFCEMVKNNGFAENFNATTGKGLRDLAYTWTPSVFLTIAHDYLV
ncbi:MAG: glycogen debranching protein [Clostridiales bacterium]|nr:glycogen debranching protein [Clostridiales bacterium]